MDRYQRLLDRLRDAVLTTSGELDADVRRAAAGRGSDLPEDLRPYVDKLRREAYKLTDADVAALRGAGYSEDQIFELTVAGAYGAGIDRLEAAMRALDADRARREGE